ncbi:MAG: plasmid recombination protein [Actinomycetota bacterium]
MDTESNAPFCILRHGRKSHTWGELRQAAAHTMRDAPWLGQNIDAERSAANLVLAGTGDVVEDVRARLAAVGLDPKPGQVVARELLLTAGSEYFAADGHSGRDGNFAPDRLAAWQAESLAFLREEFGANLCTVVLHMDEAVPHLHAWAATAVKVEKKARGRPRKDGTRPAPVIGWTLNHDKVMGTGKSAFSARQDRYAAAMAALGLRRGVRQSRAHHQPIRQFYAELPAKLAAVEAERQAARDLRLQAEQDAIRAAILRQAGEEASRRARQGQAEAEQSRRIALDRQREADEALGRARQAEHNQRALLAAVENDKWVLADDTAQLEAFLERLGQAAPFREYRADSLAVANLRQGKGDEWAPYAKALEAYADELKRYGTCREAITRRADRPLRFLLEAGAQALGHASLVRNPSRVVTDGIQAWLRLTGGEDLVRIHRTVLGWLREVWATVAEAVIEPRHRGRDWER